jgi:hypothetical protein
MKTYLVQTWDDKGAMQNHYEVCIPTAAEVKALHKFLSSKHPKVIIAEQPARPKSR